MLARLSKWDPPLVQEPHEVLPRDVEQVGRLLRRHFSTNRHNGDRIASCHHLGDPLEDVEDGRRQRDRFTLRTNVPRRSWTRMRFRLPYRVAGNRLNAPTTPSTAVSLLGCSHLKPLVHRDSSGENASRGLLNFLNPGPGLHVSSARPERGASDAANRWTSWRSVSRFASPIWGNGPQTRRTREGVSKIAFAAGSLG